jgi:predicted RNA-binding Zn-ribbon protein involved in translation (DUF1610 family)
MFFGPLTILIALVLVGVLLWAATRVAAIVAAVLRSVTHSPADGQGPVMLNCPHCGQETFAYHNTCRHCHREL